MQQDDYAKKVQTLAAAKRFESKYRDFIAGRGRNKEDWWAENIQAIQEEWDRIKKDAATLDETDVQQLDKTGQGWDDLWKDGYE